ncbi:hypothetical protein BGX27_000748 [Mortierella sp. AM989]|nr:hypothetical protein BGX27_000748 [Mortierella sp. AM989]
MGTSPPDMFANETQVTSNETANSTGSSVPENNSCNNANLIAHAQNFDIATIPTVNYQCDGAYTGSANSSNSPLVPSQDNVKSVNYRSSEKLIEPGPSTLFIVPLQQEQQEQQQTLLPSPAFLQQHLHTDNSESSTLAQLISQQIIENPSTEPRVDSIDETPLSSLPLITQSQTSSRAPPPPQLSLSPIPIFTSADEPPPYSPTHTILPHYFSLEPIPIRTYIIKDSTSIPFLYDFWLCTTPQGASPGLLFQERGLSQTQNELKYCIIRPQHTDRTAFPQSGISAQNAYFVPALALVAVNYPSRWIWWGTEALQMVVFGRQLKNIIMEWKWKHGRLRIGGPIVHRLIGCSFQITPERKYCWKQGSGRRRPATTTATAGMRQNRTSQQRSNNTDRRGERATGGGWFGSFFSRSTPSRSPGNTSDVPANGVPMDHVRITIPPIPSAETNSPIDLPAPEPPSLGDSVPLSEQEVAIDTENDEGDEAGCYHCREENSIGITGRVVAVYRPGRLANRARDRPAASPKLEIYTELGERCETALMLMCVRLDDLFMLIPDAKKGPFVPSPGHEGYRGESIERSTDGTNTQQGNNAEGFNSASNYVGIDTIDGDNRSEMSALKRLLGRRGAWKAWLKWFVAAILIAVVVILVLKSKVSNPSK